MGWRFCALGSALDIDRSSFDCETPDINEYIRNSATTFDQEDFSKVFLMVDTDSSALVGYYTLSTSVIPNRELPDEYAKGLPVEASAFPLPAILIGQFAIDRNWQGKGLSTLLLGDTYRRIVLIWRQNSLGMKAVKVDTQNGEQGERARGFWIHQGFTPFKKSPRSLFLPIKTIAQQFGL